MLTKNLAIMNQERDSLLRAVPMLSFSTAPLAFMVSYLELLTYYNTSCQGCFPFLRSPHGLRSISGYSWVQELANLFILSLSETKANFIKIKTLPESNLQRFSIVFQ